MKMSPRLKSLPAMILAALCATGLSANAFAITTVMTYDAGDNVVSVTDPRGLVTTYVHDGLGQLWQRVSPDTGSTTFSYDGYGRRATMTRADNTQTSYAYDGISRQTSLTVGGASQTLAYDNCTNGIGRVCSSGDATGSTSYSYTPEGWIGGRGFSIAGTTYAIGYGYDSVGHVTTVNYPDGNQANYAYTAGAVTSVSLKMGSVTANAATSIVYRPMNAAVSSWTASNGLANAASYDTDGRLTAISTTGIQGLSYTYDNANRITQISNVIDNTLTQNYGYDAQSQLTSVQSGADNESFQYDPNGNRTYQNVNGNALTETISSTSNQLTGVSGSSTTNYGYDAKGNTTVVNGATTYNYDGYNRLSSASGMSYYVNPEGQRLKKSSSSGTSYFAPDKGGSLLAETQGSGWTDYIWLGGRLIGKMTNSQPYAIFVDQVGRPEVVANPNQAVVWRAQNFPFYQKVVTANIAFNLGFPGQYYDAETATWNNGFRDYSSVYGRYIESDPLGLSAGINTYAYVGGNPLNSTDPTGLWQATISGGFVLGGSITFGNNSGQWNVGAYLGVGAGLAGSWNPNDSGLHACGSAGAVKASGKIGLGDGIEAEAYLGTDGNKLGIALNDGINTHQSFGVNLDDGKLQSPGAPTWTLGESGFVGGGGSYYGN